MGDEAIENLGRAIVIVLIIIGVLIVLMVISIVVAKVIRARREQRLRDAVNKAIANRKSPVA